MLDASAAARQNSQQIAERTRGALFSPHQSGRSYPN